MRNKKLSVIVLFIFLILPFSKLTAQNWFPLEVGNKWQYFSQIYFYNDPWPRLINVTVSSDTIINEVTYYKLISSVSGYWPGSTLSLARYDEVENKLYLYNDVHQTEYLEMDFNLEAGDTIQLPEWMSYYLRTVIEGTDYIFGNTIQYKGQKTDDYMGSYYLERYAVGLGHFYSYSWNHVPGVGEYDTDSYLIQSIINNGGSPEYHSHQYFPMIDSSQVTYVIDSLLYVTFNADHNYSKFYVPYGSTETLLFNFIDTVIVESYFCSRDTTILQPFGAINIQNKKRYEFEIALDSSYISNGFDYYFRLKAIDKGIIPHTKYAPNSGYFAIINDSTLDYYPEIVLNPVLSTTNVDFFLDVDVHHHYNQIYPDSVPPVKLNFINNVIVYSYYSKGDSVVTNQPIQAYNIPYTEQWKAHFLLNENYAKRGYDLKYKLEAIDKGSRPNRTFSPDTGYYTLDLVPIFNHSLSFNYPNPFNALTNIEYAVAKYTKVVLSIYNILGERIIVLVNEYQWIGKYTINFDASTLPSGIYFYQLRVGDYTETKKMVLLK